SCRGPCTSPSRWHRSSILRASPRWRDVRQPPGAHNSAKHEAFALGQQSFRQGGIMSFPHRKLLACTLGLASALLAAPRPARALDDLSTGLRDEAMRIIGRDPGDLAGSAIAVGDV